MFDVGFSELGVIGVVALIVIGPEQLPRVARTVGHITGRLRRYVSDVKADISREMEMADLKRMHEEVQSSVHSMENSLQQQMASIEQEANSIASPEVHHQLAETPVTPALGSGLEIPEQSSVAEEGETIDDGQADLFAATDTPGKP